MLTNQSQLTIEQVAGYTKNNTYQASRSTTTRVETECAWCLTEQGLEFGNGSHGICARHATQVLHHYYEIRTRRRYATATKESRCA